jgi:hypothetical protein
MLDRAAESAVGAQDRVQERLDFLRGVMGVGLDASTGSEAAGDAAAQAAASDTGATAGLTEQASAQANYMDRMRAADEVGQSEYSQGRRTEHRRSLDDLAKKIAEIRGTAPLIRRQLLSEEREFALKRMAADAALQGQAFDQSMNMAKYGAGSSKDSTDTGMYSSLATNLGSLLGQAQAAPNQAGAEAVLASLGLGANDYIKTKIEGGDGDGLVDFKYNLTPEGAARYFMRSGMSRAQAWQAVNRYMQPSTGYWNAQGKFVIRK